MPNDTIYWDKLVFPNDDGTRTEVKRAIRINRDRSEMVKFVGADGETEAVWHVVYNASAMIVHGQEVKMMREGAVVGFPPKGYELN